MIDAPWNGSGTYDGDGNVGGYTAVSWKNTANGSVDDGLTVTPNEGDTSKTLFIPNTGYRGSGATSNYGTECYSFSAEQHHTSTSNAWRIYFGSGYTSGRINNINKLAAYPIRCVRS